jgi:large subunit ribosomal protein L21
MYAIIRAGGHQEKVTPGEQITVDHLKQEVGEEVKFTPLLISKDDGTVVSDHQQLSDQGSVVGTILQHVRGDKIDVFQYRQKTGYRRHTGHRQPLTLIHIAEIRLGEEVFTAPEPPAEPEPVAEEPAEAAPQAKAMPRARKSAAKKPAAKKSTAKRAPRTKK